MRDKAHERRNAVLHEMGKALPERAFSAADLAHFAHLTLPQTKGALQGLYRLGLVRKSTDPRRPTCMRYFRVPENGS